MVRRSNTFRMTIDTQMKARRRQWLSYKLASPSCRARARLDGPPIPPSNAHVAGPVTRAQRIPRRSPGRKAGPKSHLAMCARGDSTDKGPTDTWARAWTNLLREGACLASKMDATRSETDCCNDLQADLKHEAAPTRHKATYKAALEVAASNAAGRLMQALHWALGRLGAGGH